MAHPLVPEYDSLPGGNALADQRLGDLRRQEMAKNDANLAQTQAQTEQTQTNTERTKQLMPWDVKNAEQRHEAGALDMAGKQLGQQQTAQNMGINANKEQRDQAKWERELDAETDKPDFYGKIGAVMAQEDMPLPWRMATAQGLMSRSPAGKMMWENMQKEIANGTLKEEDVGKRFSAISKKMIEDSAAMQKQEAINAARQEVANTAAGAKIKQAEIQADARVKAAQLAAENKAKLAAMKDGPEKAKSTDQLIAMYYDKARQALQEGNVALANEYNNYAQEVAKTKIAIAGGSKAQDNTLEKTPSGGYEIGPKGTPPLGNIGNHPGNGPASVPSATNPSKPGIPTFVRGPDGKLKQQQ